MVGCPLKVFADSIVDPDFSQQSVFACNLGIEAVECRLQQRKDVEAPVDPPSKPLPPLQGP